MSSQKSADNNNNNLNNFIFFLMPYYILLGTSCSRRHNWEHRNGTMRHRCQEPIWNIPDGRNCSWSSLVSDLCLKKKLKQTYVDTSLHKWLQSYTFHWGCLLTDSQKNYTLAMVDKIPCRLHHPKTSGMPINNYEATVQNKPFC